MRYSCACGFRLGSGTITTVRFWSFAWGSLAQQFESKDRNTKDSNNGEEIVHVKRF